MENIDEFLSRIIDKLDDNFNIVETAKTISNNLVNKYGYRYSNNLEKKVYGLLIKYKNKSIDINTFISSIKSNDYTSAFDSNINSTKNTFNESPFKSSNTYKPTSSSSDKSSTQSSVATSKLENPKVSEPPKQSSKSTAVIDLDTEFINAVSSDYNTIEQTVKTSTIEIGQEDVAAAASSLTETMQSEAISLQEDLNSLKDIMVESLTSLEFIDEQVGDVDLENFDFNDIWKYSGDVIASGVKVADAAFFEQCGYSVEKNIVTVGEYTYNIATHKLSVNGVQTEALIYIPTGVDDFKKVNTVTMFDKVETGHTISNSILISLGEKDGLRLEQVTNATKFVNRVADTDLTKCQNIITGGSRFGARSLKFAADSGDLYQTVVCINNAILVKGQNAAGGGKEAFNSLEQLQRLNGKNIFLVSSKDDPNLTMRYGHNSEFDRSNDVTKCYVYTGINLAIENCPDSKIYFVTNSDNKAFSEISAPNYYYNRNLWEEFASSNDYRTHDTYHKIMSDMIGKKVIGYNGYTDQRG